MLDASALIEEGQRLLSLRSWSTAAWSQSIEESEECVWR
jgi:hypothetical protein